MRGLVPVFVFLIDALACSNYLKSHVFVRSCRFVSVAVPAFVPPAGLVESESAAIVYRPSAQGSPLRVGTYDAAASQLYIVLVFYHLCLLQL